RDDREVDDQEGLPADERAESAGQAGERQVGPQGARPFALPGEGDVERDAVLDHELVERSDDEEDQRMPVQAVPEAAPERFRAELPTREGAAVAARALR